MCRTSMFNKTSKSASTPAAAPTVLESTDIVIRTMPREFYGKDASIVEAARQSAPAPVATPPPVPVPPPVQKPILIAAAPKKHSKLGITLTIIISLFVISGIAYGAYVLIGNANRAAEEAQREAADAAAEREAERAEQEAAAERAAAEAARAAATPSPGKDTDSDGLTDVEELLYGTNFRDPDSDEDAYLDGNEVFHRYHPLGTAPATLLDTGAVKVFADASYPYALYYPSTWTVALVRDRLGVTFQSARQASIGVTWEAKDESETLDDLLDGDVTASERAQMKEVLTKEGFFGLTSADDRTAYLDLGSAMATLTYDLGGKAQIEYLQTFQMMVNSFTLASQDTVTPAP